MNLRVESTRVVEVQQRICSEGAVGRAVEFVDVDSEDKEGVVVRTVVAAGKDIAAAVIASHTEDAAEVGVSMAVVVAAGVVVEAVRLDVEDTFAFGAEFVVSWVYWYIECVAGGGMEVDWGGTRHNVAEAARVAYREIGEVSEAGMETASASNPESQREPKSANLVAWRDKCPVAK